MVRAGVLASLVGSAYAAEWAVLVAGSKEYANYRHQADICHAYQIVKAHGIPESNIITMLYDDVAHSPLNPFPGKLFNKPTGWLTPGVDVYEGCKIDYKGADVTPENFIKVLTGTATGKALKSTSDDNVFINFADHGAPGLIAFPSSTLHKADLQSALETMHTNNMYKKLTFYLETCESGSMFEGLSTPGVYAVSAASPTQSSYGTYCGSQARVHGKKINSCLGDLFSVNWMQDSDAKDITQEKLSDQFATVAKKTDKSTVMQWGDLSFQSDTVSEYQGSGKATAAPEADSALGNIPTRQIDLMQAYEAYTEATSTQGRLAAGKELQRILADQLEAETAFQRFLDILHPGDSEKQHAMRQGTSPADHRDCEMTTRQAFVDHGKFDAHSAFALQFQRVIVEACAEKVNTGSNVDLVAAAKKACSATTLV